MTPSSKNITAILLIYIAVAACIFQIVHPMRATWPNIDYGFISIFSKSSGMDGAKLEQTATIPIERQLLLIESIGEIRSVTTDHCFSIKIKPDLDEALPLLPSIKERLKNVSLPPNTDDPDIHAIHTRNSPFLLIAVHGAENPATCNRSAEYLNRFIGDRGRTECENGPIRLNGTPIGLINVYSAEQEDQILLRKSIQEHMPAGMKIIDDASLLLERQFTTIELCLAVFFGLTV
ncbi:MAG: efflux RND transporter permease subunit, partial [Leptospiraceae bacterium]|nr:efflux RND transporter permease subunit [Leptospiraceae bacterium]